MSNASPHFRPAHFSFGSMPVELLCDVDAVVRSNGTDTFLVGSKALARETSARPSVALAGMFTSKPSLHCPASVGKYIYLLTCIFAGRSDFVGIVPLLGRLFRRFARRRNFPFLSRWPHLLENWSCDFVSVPWKIGTSRRGMEPDAVAWGKLVAELVTSMASIKFVTTSRFLVTPMIVQASFCYRALETLQLWTRNAVGVSLPCVVNGVK
jgi:hypothetical protein